MNVFLVNKNRTIDCAGLLDLSAPGEVVGVYSSRQLAETAALKFMETNTGEYYGVDVYEVTTALDE